MLRAVLLGLAGAIAGYAIGAVGGALLIHLTSSNTHDGSVEAAMTGAFVTGPLLALVGGVLGVRRARRRSPR
jgi:ABC-type antimicrobial peptide transport system permease subunit